MGPSPAASDTPVCVLLLPTPLERFILRDQAQDLVDAPGVVAVDPARVPYGAYARLPEGAGNVLAATQARRLVRTLAEKVGTPRVLVIFHALQYQLARAVLAAVPGCELWYWRWDRYERAHDAGPKLRALLEALHEQAAARATLVIGASDELVRLEREAGRDATLVALSADAFPAPVATATVVAISLGHLGWRTDWALVREVAERLGDDLVLLLAGAWHEEECRDDPDFAACRALPNLVWLGTVDDEAAARLILCADVGIVPFKVEPFNDAGLPYRILKYARVGRRTVAPDLAGARTWERAVTIATDAEAFAAALRARAGARLAPDDGLREWALAQTAAAQNAPLRERLGELGIATRRASSR